jgi:hypothetical protein
MPTYDLVTDPQVWSLMEDMKRRYHGELVDLEVTVGLQWALPDLKKNGKPSDKPALTLRGWPCYALAQVTSYENRVRGLPDAFIKIDRREWGGLAEEEQAALLDHELEHFVLARDKDGHPTADKHGRPRLKIRPHDYELKGFYSVIRRHGAGALERTSFRNVVNEHGQLLLDFEDGRGGEVTLTVGGRTVTLTEEPSSPLRLAGV